MKGVIDYITGSEPEAQVTALNSCDYTLARLDPVLKTIFHQCVISFTCSQSSSDGSVLSFINVSYHILLHSQSNSDGSVLSLSLKTEPSELDWLQENDMTHG